MAATIDDSINYSADLFYVHLPNPFYLLRSCDKKVKSHVELFMPDHVLSHFQVHEIYSDKTDSEKFPPDFS